MGKSGTVASVLKTIWCASMGLVFGAALTASDNASAETDAVACLSRFGNLVSNTCDVAVYCYAPGTETWAAIEPVEIVRATSSDNSHDGAVFRYLEDTTQCRFAEPPSLSVASEVAQPVAPPAQTAEEAFAPLSNGTGPDQSTGALQ